MIILLVLLNCIYSNIILAPTLPESLSRYLVQSKYTPLFPLKYVYVASFYENDSYLPCYVAFYLRHHIFK